MRLSIRLLLLGSLVAACSEPASAPAPAPKPEAAAPKPVAAVSAPPPVPGSSGLAPAPYTAEQIRKASAPGRTYEFMIEEDGKPTVKYVMTFEKVTDANATIRDEFFDGFGKPVGLPSVETSAWTDLRHHGEFPKAELKITESSVVVPAGSYVCDLYTVTRTKGDDITVSSFFFARDLPGPPVRMLSFSQGKLAKNMTLVRYVAGK